VVNFIGTPDMIGEFVDVLITSVFSNSLRGDVIQREKDMGLRVAVSPHSILAKQATANDLGVIQVMPA
jgi:tRNA-2-methylthio-N6-dimethylallyladenosine synthase